MRPIFSKKGKKIDNIVQNIWKRGQSCTKFENTFQKGSLMRVTIACMKQLEYALNTVLKMGLVTLPLYSGPKLAVRQ